MSISMEGAMEYLGPSFTEEMINLEQEVGKELEEISHSFKTNTAQAIIREYCMYVASFTWVVSLTLLLSRHIQTHQLSRSEILNS